MPILTLRLHVGGFGQAPITWYPGCGRSKPFERPARPQGSGIRPWGASIDLPHNCDTFEPDTVFEKLLDEEGDGIIILPPLKDVGKKMTATRI